MTDKATQVIADTLAENPCGCGTCIAIQAAKILAALKSAGLAVVELPEPYTREHPVGFSADGYGITIHQGRVWDGDDECEGHAPDGARAIGAMWIAAAQLVEPDASRQQEAKP